MSIIDFSKIVILLYGSPCSGKYTIAKVLAKKYDLHLVDNHFFNNLIFPFVDLNKNNKQSNDDLFDGILKIKQVWFEKVVKYGKLDKGFVFTNVLDNSLQDRKCLQQFIDFAKQINYRFVPIKLIMDEEQIRNNVSNKDRKDRCKLSVFSDYQKFVREHQALDISGSMVIKNENIDKTIQQIEVFVTNYIKQF